MHPSRRIACASILILLAACAGQPARGPTPGDGARATLAILESTDVHSNVLGYDYYKLAEDPSLGFERLATLVRQARREYANTLLFDAGDTIQGTALADWQARGEPLACGDKLAMYKAMDALGYDGGTIGNHEFNYGLPFLAQVTNSALDVDGVTPKPCKGPDFPIVLANVDSKRSGRPLFAPTAVIERRIAARDARGDAIEATVRIGLIGFTPPPILQWDKDNLDGRVSVSGVVEAARRHLPALRAQGVDFVIAISHGGINPSPHTHDMENANWHLAAEPGIDVLLLGHSHQVFPDPGNPKSRFARMPEVDNERGFLRGKPAVMGGFWGKNLGLIELALVHEGGHWRIDHSATRSHVRDIRRAAGDFVEPDPAIAAAIEAEHAATIRYVSTPIGSSDFAMTSHFVALGDVSAIEPVNRAQRDFVRKRIAETRPDLADLPVLSAVAPFKVGFAGATDYTDIAAGPLAIRNAADLYLYPNTIAAVLVNGAELRAWLDKASTWFNRIDPQATTPQELVNRRFPGYNFDVVQGGISWRIDLSRPAGERIVDLRHEGQPVDAAQRFILATNNYRAGGGGDFPGTGGDRVVLSDQIMNRDLLIDWVRARGRLTRDEDASDRPWRFVPLRTAAPVSFTTASGKDALARAAGITGLRLLRENGDGTSTYALDLSVEH
ncbi:bifunctional 2',3'-cyclic-nucleotide 2'-phosphodiesterase/3'-nucleotidase [Dokdonella sp.]|uniref:bifunctional 2',3'-cyclic-nucleotide 2'-phosphodiesterase/3'-nucleotidase n=1 Tax=Dokdonella sp. TaxID=2291710 RepID=UPI0025C352C6|nr:bifunctional 2',3'-cyclic-nucleotide 2'-phosphodiesterase/3'-nucleotidase [Dokdonella sp.]MBX3693126.1 bifunctional 2',3'-cyclic-nucleotide 2'-phosphodiesterase/3'-nucleotidase [Dokdonella sp.]MCW5568244.1 bifunctional 2',3'-cyclic-nucleotide 2'-phosphodiesterase/3'-nucleotidase [Dokdonella sp.]